MWPDVSAILIAAGESSRMGRLKQLLPWKGVPLIEYQTASLMEAGVKEVVVVLGFRHEAVAPHVKGPGVRYVLNLDWQLGKTTSIKVGIESIDPDAAAILLLAVDQPRSPEIISAVMDAYLRCNTLITSPRFQGRGGHPIIFSSKLRGELAAISEEKQGIREVFQTHRDEVNEVEADSMIRLDLNSLDAYNDAKIRHQA